MSFNIEVEGGKSVRLPTKGKYCDRDIVVTAKGGGAVLDPVIEPLEVTENGTYTAPGGVDGYSPISVQVPIPDGYIVPSGLKKITANGSYDVTDKAGVVVAVPEREIVLQYKEITSNGTYSADDGYDGLGEVDVNVPIPDGYIQPSGELEVTENGTHDVTAYASVSVKVKASSGGDSDLPTGYRRADYIQFTGEQVVDTGIICNQNTKIQAAFTREKSTQHYLFGVASSGNTASVTAYMGGSFRFGNKSASKNPNTDEDMIYSAIFSGSEITITGSKSAISGVNAFETVGTLLIGTCRAASGAVGEAQFIGKISFFVMWEGDEQVLKLVPVTDGTAFRFFDLVSKKFFDSITDTPLDGGDL